MPRAAKKDLHQEITNKIIGLLKKDKLPWLHTRWDNPIPHNPFTDRNYNGINILLLWAEQNEKKYTTNLWATFKQIKDAGGQVKANEKGTTVVFYKVIEVEDDEDDEDEDKTIPIVRGYTVFNLSQTKGLDPDEFGKQKPNKNEVFEVAEKFIKGIKAKVQYGGNEAYYSITDDYIQSPHIRQFTSSRAFYATLLHEHVHWTGAKKRLNRSFGVDFKDDEYAFEELVAELGAAFTSAELNIGYNLKNHAVYLTQYIKILKKDKKAIFRAAAQASKATKLLRLLSQGKRIRAALAEIRKVG